MYDASLKARWDNKNFNPPDLHRKYHYGTRIVQLRTSRWRAIEQGLQQGKVEGKQEKALEIARKMKKKGTSLSEMIEMTGLSKEEIEQL